MRAEGLKRVAARLIGGRVNRFETVGAGRNSRVYRVIGADERRYALKAYFRQPRDERDRLATEYCALGFLWTSGVRDVPEPLAVDHDAGCALYEYVDGAKLEVKDLAAADIKVAVAFLARLRDLRDRVGDVAISPASEACFSGRALVANLRQRLERLAAHHGQRSGEPDLRAFLADELTPVLRATVERSRTRLDFDRELDAAERTLSPSDFGFHNALRRPNGWLVFLDFEYFGWDDPAKTICDFVLHPGMELPGALKELFVRLALGRFAELGGLRERVEALYPLFGLKWCLILLNEFLPEHLSRREFAGLSGSDRRKVRSVQLAKARRILWDVVEADGRFPYVE